MSVSPIESPFVKILYTVAMLSFFIRLLRWRLGLSDSAEQPRISAGTYVPEYIAPDRDKLLHPDPTKIQISWVGHSTFLIQVAGKNILTDPMWSNRASPISFMGPKRHAHPGIAWDELPPIDLALISHTHYDHLDRPTVRRIGNAAHFIVPTNVGVWFAKQGITNTTELAWWQREQIGDLSITFVPANHWSKRNLIGTSGAGWGGFIIESSAGTVYFAGDTGKHASYFKEIGTRFPVIDVGLIPIGAYYPQWIFGRFHVDPHDAVIIHKEVGAKKSIGMHWGTFKLTEEPPQEPPTLLAKEAATLGLAPEAFTAMKFGEMRVFSNGRS